MLKPYLNTKYQVVSDNYLEAMLSHLSAVAHRYWLDRITDHFAYVVYSNPNEYGSETPVTIMYPVYRSGDTVHVVLDVYRVQGGDDEYDRDAAADSLQCMLEDQPDLYRNPQTGEWETGEEFSERRGRLTDPSAGGTD